MESRQACRSLPIATHTNGAMSKSVSVWPFPAASLPSSTGSVTISVRSGLIRNGCTPSATCRGRLHPDPRRDLVVLALVLQRGLACEHLAHDPYVFFRAGERLAVRHAVPTLDHLRPRRANAEEE